jgi:hypothetical protein
MAEASAGVARCRFQRNLIAVGELRSSYTDPILYSEPMSRFFYSATTRAFTRAFIQAATLPHPRRGTAPEIDEERLRGCYDDARSIFVIPVPAENPPLAALHPGKGSAVQCIDLGGSFLSRPDPLRRLQRFARLSALSLRNCGLLELPPDLLDPPRTLHFLDLSANFIAAIPAAPAWAQIKGLNLSDNAFVDWPVAVSPASVPALLFLSLAGNAIGNAPDDIGFFKHLRVIDCSNTLMTIIPTWLSESPHLRIVKFSGVTQCTQFPLKYLAQFAELRYVDISGVGLYGTCDEIGQKLVLMIAKGADPSAYPKGSYHLMV